MIIIGCDYHPGFQQIAFVDTDTGELQERLFRSTMESRSASAYSMPMRGTLIRRQALAVSALVLTTLKPTIHFR